MSAVCRIVNLAALPFRTALLLAKSSRLSFGAPKAMRGPIARPAPIAPNARSIWRRGIWSSESLSLMLVSLTDFHSAAKPEERRESVWLHRYHIAEDLRNVR